MKKLSVSFVLVLVACLAVAAAPAVAKKPHYRVTVSINFAHGTDKDDFSGRVKSKKHKCMSHRVVRLKRKRRGPDTVVAKDRSNRNGDWHIAIPYPGAKPGGYYAKVKRKETKNFVCKRARSSVLFVPKTPD